MEELITNEELAAYLKKSPAALAALRYRGVGPPAIYVGRELRFKRSAVEIWLNEQAEERPLRVS